MAVHSLALLSRSPEGYSSAYLANSVNTHAVFLRRVVGRLVQAGLVVAREGREGGYQLALPAEQITLADVYRVTRAQSPLPPSPAVPNPQCEVGSGIQAALGEVATDAEQQLLSELERHSIAEVADRAVHLGSLTEPRRAR